MESIYFSMCVCVYILCVQSRLRLTKPQGRKRMRKGIECKLYIPKAT